MILRMDSKGNTLEAKCDICGQVFDDESELNEFIRFNYTMGEQSLYPNFKVEFDVCQDCFTDKFDEIFEVQDDDNVFDTESV